MTAPTCALDGCNNPVTKKSNRHWRRCCCTEHARVRANIAARRHDRSIDIGRMREMVAQGAGAVEIATAFGVQPNSVWRVANKHNIDLRHSPSYRGGKSACLVTPFWQANDAKLIAEYQAGTPIRQIAQKIGATVGAVAGRLNRLDRIGERKGYVAKPIAAPLLPPIGACAWPMGDGWCGEEVEGRRSYCPEHTMRARRPTAALNVAALT